MSLFCPSSYLSHVLFLANKLKKTTTKSIWEDKRALYQIPAVISSLAQTTSEISGKKKINMGLVTNFHRALSSWKRKLPWFRSVITRKQMQDFVIRQN